MEDQLKLGDVDMAPLTQHMRNVLVRLLEGAQMGSLASPTIAALRTRGLVDAGGLTVSGLSAATQIVDSRSHAVKKS